MRKRLIPFCHAKNIYEVNLDFFVKQGVRYLFIDLDNTLDSYKCEKPSKRVIDLRNTLEKNGIEIIITSNNTGKRVGKYANTLNVRFISSIGKPFAAGLNKNIKKLGLRKEDIILIGDQTTTDISSANGAHLKNVLTDKIVKEDQPTTRINRLLDNPLRKKLKKKKLLKDWRDL